MIRVSDPDFELHLGDVRDVLRELDADSIDCVVTSPPYWGLRDYGTGEWEGGESGHAHVANGGRNTDANTPPGGGAIPRHVPGAPNRGGVNTNRCDCGAVRADKQIGLERTVGEYVASIVDVFREVRRVLTPHGTAWLNLGDTYNAYNGNRGTESKYGGDRAEREPAFPKGHGLAEPTLKQKDLVLVPARCAIALTDDGWHLRSDVIWAKKNPMPESTTDRPTKSHEHLFLLTKRPRYFYDRVAIAEPAEWDRWGDQTTPKHEGTDTAVGWIGSKPKNVLTKRRSVRDGVDTNGGGQGNGEMSWDGDLRNKRDVWFIATEPNEMGACEDCDAVFHSTRDAQRHEKATGHRLAQHFASFPRELARTAILAGCPEGGTVLDPFMGSGTTAEVARSLNRRCVGIELREAYARMIEARMAQLSLLAT